MTLEELKKLLESDEGKKLLDPLIEEAKKGLVDKNNELLGKLKKIQSDKEEAEKKLQEKLDAEEEADSEKNKKKNDWDTEKKKLTEKYTKEIQDRDAKLAAKDSQINNLVVESGIDQALIKANIAKQHIPAVKALLKTSHKIEISTDDETPKAVVEGKALDEFITTWSKGDIGKHYVAAQNNNGGGANGSNREANGGTGNQEISLTSSPSAKLNAARAAAANK